MRRARLLLLAGLAWAAPVAAQGPRASSGGDTAPVLRVANVAPGAVTTAVVTAEAALPPGVTATYELTAAPGVRLFSDAVGPVDALTGEPVLVPMTFALGAQHPAGDTELARLVVVRSDGTRSDRAVVAEVLARRRLSLSLASPSPFAVAGDETRLDWRLVNLGNAPDSVRLTWETPPGWRVRPAGTLVVVGPGESREGAAGLLLPAETPAGQSGLVRVVAHGRGGGRAQAVLPLSAQDAGHDFARLPGEVVLGAGPGGAVFAAHASGRTAGDTHVELSVRHGTGPVMAAGPAGFADGLLVRAAASAPGWAVAVGEAPVAALPLAGGPMTGVGADVRLRAGDADLRVVLLGADGRARPGDRLALVGATSRGRHPGGLVVFAGEQGRVGGGTLAGGALTWRLGDHPRHRLVADAGLLAVGSTAGTAVGPSASAAYDYVDFRRSLSVRLRHVPASGAVGGALPQEASVGGRLALPASLTLHGWGSATRYRRAGVLTAGVDLASLGLDWAPGAARLSAVGSVRRTASAGLATDRRAILLSAGYQLGTLRADLGVDAGEMVVGATRAPTGSVRGSVVWTRGERVAWASVTRQTDGGGRRVMAEIGASLPGRRVTLDGGLSAAGPRLAPATWGRAAVHVGGGWDVLGGLRLAPRTRADVSVALRRRLRVPVPARPEGAAWGRVFDDTNGNGRADAGEPGLAGVLVRAGALMTVTDADGRWALRGAASQAQAPAIDAATLPPGYVLPGGADAPAAGRVDLPAIRAATLVLDLFEDADGDGVRGPREPGLAGALVRVEDAAGRVRWADGGGDGRSRLTGLSPGRLRVTVRVPAAGPREASDRAFELDLAPGAEARIVVGASSSARRVRFGG